MFTRPPRGGTAASANNPEHRAHLLAGRLGGAGGAGRKPPFEMLQSQFDTNDDGRIEKDEVVPALHGRFDQLDTNGDGVLTKDGFGG